MNKREAVLNILEEGGPQQYVPAAFFVHFDSQYHQGQAAIDKHLAYFRKTDMDILKVQYEHIFSRVADIERPQDWRKSLSFDGVSKM